jgi:hypothetical protein
MLEERMPERMLKGCYSPEGRKGRPRARWLGSVVTDLVVMVIRDWRGRVEGRVCWRRLVNEAEAHQGL